MIVKIYTNELKGGWEPEDLETGIGGSEESVIQLARAFAEDGHKVCVYRTERNEDESFREMPDGVVYAPHDMYQSGPEDILISFKTRDPWKVECKAQARIQWSCDIDLPWNMRHLDAYVCISPFHMSRMVWIPSRVKKWFPLGVDKKSLETNRKHMTHAGQMLYCSSLDRGLSQLLLDWRTLKEHRPDASLKVAYGMEGIYKFASPELIRQTEHMIRQMDELDGVEYLGRVSRDELENLYWESQYWALPLNHANSELFCLNAVKAQYQGAIPVVNKLGALQNTVGEYIDYKTFVQGGGALSDQDKAPQIPAHTWSEVLRGYWLPLIDQIIANERKGAA